MVDGGDQTTQLGLKEVKAFGPDDKTVVYYILISILATLTVSLVGLICICRKVPQIREKCCYSSVDVGKEDENPDYGEYRQAWLLFF